MPYTLTVNFTLANPDPGSYRVKFWPTANPANVTTRLVSNSPFQESNLPGCAYTGTVEASCGGGQYSSAQSFSVVCPTVYYYYAISKFDCANNCAQVGGSGSLVGRSTTQLSTTSGVYYKVGGFTYQVVNEILPAPSTFDVDLNTATTSDISCTTACGNTPSPSSFTITNMTSNVVSLTDFNPAWFTIDTGTPSNLSAGASAAGTHSGYTGNWSITVGSNINGCLVLRKNEGELITSIAITNAGIYTFQNLSILSTDEVVLEITNSCP